MSKKRVTTLSKKRRTAKPKVPPLAVHSFVDRLFSEDMHAARIGSLSSAVTGVLHTDPSRRPDWGSRHRKGPRHQPKVSPISTQ